MTLEELLNKLIEKGWKPFGKPFKSVIDITHRWVRYITSKESWLWQFCVAKGMIDDMSCRNERNKYYEFEMSDDVYTGKGYEYRLIESALTDEDKLEEFLLNSIVINND